MLTLDSAVPYLLGRGLVSVESILSGELAVWSVARRHPNLRVERTDGPGYLLKQPDGSSTGAAATLRREALVYRLLEAARQAAEPGLARVAALVPRLADLDPEGPRLVLELVPGPASLRQRWGALVAERPPVDEARAVGRALATVHAAFQPLVTTGDPRLDPLPRSLPWVLQVHRPSPELLATLSRANHQTLRVLQTEEEMSRHLDALVPSWTPETLIHGDVKADNLLTLEPGPDASPGSATAGALPEVRLVDWELAQVGDPAWDVAGFLQDVLLVWITSMPLGRETAPDALADAAGWPLAVLQRVLRGFWRGYGEASSSSADPLLDRLGRAVAFSGARLVQTAYELAHDAETLPDHSVLCLQVASNLLADPEAGRVELYGLWEAPAP